MSRLLGQAPESTGQWSVAALGSFGLHGMAVAALFISVSPFATTPAIRPTETLVTIAPMVSVEDDVPDIGTDPADTTRAAEPDAALQPAALSDERAEVGVPDTAAVASDATAPALTAERADPQAERAPAEQAPTASPENTPEEDALASPLSTQSLAPLVPEAARATLNSAAIAAGPSIAPAPLQAAPLQAAQPSVPSSDTVAAPVPTVPAQQPVQSGAPVLEPARDIARLSPDAAISSGTDLRPRAARPQETSDPALLDLVDRIRGRLSDACLVALPRPRPAPAEPLVTTLSDQDVTAARFAADVLSNPEFVVEEDRLLIDARQCPALNFLRSAPGYPAFQLQIGLASTQLASGDTLVGRIEGAAGAYTSLLLIDDNGVVQDLRRFLRFSGGVAEFAIPVTRNGPVRETAQLLIALATPNRPETITQLAGRLAGDVFPNLEAEIGALARLAVQPIDVR